MNIRTVGRSVGGGAGALGSLGMITAKNVAGAGRRGMRTAMRKGLKYGAVGGAGLGLGMYLDNRSTGRRGLTSQNRGIRQY